MVRVTSGCAVWMACTAAPLLTAAPAHAQQAPVSPADALSAPDPGEDLAPLPDLGVAWPDPAAIDAAPAAAPTEVKGIAADRLLRYRVVLEGAEPLGSTFHSRFEQLSALVINQGKPANAAQINRRARDDEDLVRQLLAAQGYYEGRVVSTVSSTPNSGDTVVRVTVTPGDSFHFTAVELPGLETAGSNAAALRGTFTVKPGQAVDAETVTNAVTAFKVELGHRGYPFAKVADPVVTIDHQANAATLSMAVTPGPRAAFGRIVPQGARPLFSARHLATIARFHPGQRYDAARLDDFRRALIATGLVSSVTLTPTRTTDPAVVDIAVQIERAPPRTVAGEFGYGTGEGARAEISWQHRNLIPSEGAVTFRGVLGTREQSLGATLRRGNWHARDRVLNAQIVAAHSNFDAYDARSFTLGASVERLSNIIWQKTWSWTIGSEFVATDERDTVKATGLPQRRTFLVAAAPSSLGYDSTDDLLNPTRGFRLSGHLSPELSLQAGTHAYAKMQLDASAYQPFGRVVLAGRLRFGSIEGVARDDIAPSRRFYSGGGGSVRGYGYQKIGPVDIDGNPIGGRALTEFAAEARVRFGNFGLVPFLDGGNLYSGTTPKFSGLRYGTGMGVRYYSSFGPIRVDVGTPLDRRRGESKVAVYVSLGQAF